MEFSDDYNTFQLKSLSNTVMDFSTDYASLTLRRGRSGSVITKHSQHSRNTTTMVRRISCLMGMVVVMLVAVVLPNMPYITSDLSAVNYLTTGEEGDFSAFSMVPKKVAVEATDDNANAEVLNSLKAALEMQKQQKIAKAKKLFLHALALSPRHARTLLHYGQFLEESDHAGHDLVEADHQFARAVIFSYSQADLEVMSEAVAARKRTATKVELIDDQVLERIDKKKVTFLDIRADSAALKRAKKEAYFQYIYHTVGIEGNTMNLAQTRSILETKLAVAGKSIMEHNEILGMDAALKYINNTLVDKIGDITLQDILEMHRRVIGNVDPVEAGLFRRSQVYIGNHVPPPPSLLYNLMTKFTDWLNSVPAMSLHPVRLAALAHYKLVHIHPFVDGNGRTSRLLMNLVLMQAGFPPVIIRRADRDTYYNHLVTANDGDIRPFIRFIAHCTEKTLDAYLWASQEYTSPAGELESMDLPHNLVEHTVELVNNDVRNYREMKEKSGSWLNFEEANDMMIVGDDIGDQLVINMDPVL